MNLFELQTPTEIQTLEQHLDQLMAPVGLDVEFSRHFVERLLGREQRVTVEEIIDAFTKLKQKYKQRLKSAKNKPGYEAILKDFDSDLNIVFGIRADEPIPDLVNITIKKKDPSAFVPNVQGGEELKVGRSRLKELFNRNLSRDIDAVVRLVADASPRAMEGIGQIFASVPYFDDARNKQFIHLEDIDFVKPQSLRDRITAAATQDEYYPTRLKKRLYKERNAA